MTEETKETKKDLTVVEQQPLTDVFSNMQAFSNAQRICKALTQSGIVPVAYQGEQNLPNAMVALEMANRIGISPISVMQNLHVIEGRPSWSSNFIISMLNSSGKFTPLRFKYENRGKKNFVRTGKKWNKKLNQYEDFKEELEAYDIICYAYATDKLTGEVIEGPEASVEMAMQEGWLTKNGSKWRTMPKIMLAYRAAAFFGRLYAPEFLLGIHAADELYDISMDIPSTPKIIEPDGDIPGVIEPEFEETEPEEVDAEIIVEDQQPEKTPETVEEKVASIVEPEKKPQRHAPEKKGQDTAAKAPFMFNFEE